jgi:hypothetical protein
VAGAVRLSLRQGSVTNGRRLNAPGGISFHGRTRQRTNPVRTWPPTGQPQSSPFAAVLSSTVIRLRTKCRRLFSNLVLSNSMPPCGHRALPNQFSPRQVNSDFWQSIGSIEYGNIFKVPLRRPDWQIFGPAPNGLFRRSKSIDSLVHAAPRIVLTSDLATGTAPGLDGSRWVGQARSPAFVDLSIDFVHLRGIRMSPACFWIFCFGHWQSLFEG